MTALGVALTPRRSRWLAIGLLLVLFAQLATSSTAKSAVFDEPLHSARAYYVAATGDWRMQAGHLPLLYRLLTPLFWVLPERPALGELTQSPDHVKIARDIIHVLHLPWDSLIFPLRVMVMGLALILGVILFRWAEERHGARGGLLAIFVYAFSPNILAHGRLVTTDLAVTCFFFLAVYAFQRLLDRPTLRRGFGAGLSLGLALGAKASALVLLPAFFLLVVTRFVGLASGRTRPSAAAISRAPRLLSDLTWLVFTGMIATLVVWLLYGLEIGPWAEGWPRLPLPSYLKSLSQVREHGATRGHPAFLMGERSGGGWWSYFPIALAIKTPVPTLVAALGGSIHLLLRRRHWDWVTGFVPGALFLLVAMFSTLNIGYRHVLPVVPFLILLLSSLAELRWAPLPRTVIGGGLAIWLAVGTLSIYPHYLAYFNVLVGGPDGGHHYLTDSNLDWGQDLKGLGNYIEEHDLEKVQLSYFGTVDPTAYGIRYEPLPSHFPIGDVQGFTPFAPAPGIYAISVTNLSGQFLVQNPTVLDWFNHQEAVASIGHSINVYQIEPDSRPPTWVGICLAPGAPLESATFARRAGREDLRYITFDCRSSWVFANEGDPAWFVVPATEETDHIVPPASSWRRTYEQENYDGKVLFTIYRWGDTPALTAHLAALNRPAPLPARFGENLTLLGYEVDSTGASGRNPVVRIGTYWRVLARPDRALSLMVHLVNAEGKRVAIGDALDVPVEGWAPGDIIVQRHRLALKAEVSSDRAQLQVGAYWWPSLERLPVFDEGGDRLADDVIRLGQIDLETAR